MTGEPDLVQGAWMRQAASIDGGPFFETQRVVWLQAGTCYADLRVPFHPAADRRCFTGRSFWDADAYRWTHHLDLESADGEASPAADDVGLLRWSDGALVETGMFPTPTGPVAYEEIWVRLPGDTGPWLALDGPDGCLVRVGDHAITVVDRRASGGTFAACYRILGADGWQIEMAIGGVDALPGPDAAVEGWSVIHSGGKARVAP
ncbi:MAG: hypothetical protein ACHQNA_03170 [Acidimicrobiales bacterium]